MSRGSPELDLLDLEHPSLTAIERERGGVINLVVDVTYIVLHL